MNPAISHINPADLATLGTLFAGLTLALLLAFAKKVRQTANLFLSAALAVTVLKAGGLTPLFLPALGPLLYFYVRQLCGPDTRFNKKDLLHFCPLLLAWWLPQALVFLFVIVYLYLSYQLIQDFYKRLRPVLMDRSRFAFRLLESVLLLLGLCCVLALFNNSLSLPAALVLIGIAVESIIQPENNDPLAIPVDSGRV